MNVRFYTSATKVPSVWDDNSFYLFTAAVADGTETYGPGLYLGKELLSNDAKVESAIESINTLTETVGEIPEGAEATTIVDYINEKTKGIATDTALNLLQDAVDELDEKIDALTGRVGTLEGLVGGPTTDGAAATGLHKDIADLKDADTALDARVQSVEKQLKDVSNVMDFIGVRTVTIDDETGEITVTAVEGETFNAGDVVVDNGGKEYVYDGSAWHEFGYTDANTAAITNIQEQLNEAFESNGSTVKHATNADTATNATQLGGVAAADYATQTEVTEALEKLESEHKLSELGDAAYANTSDFATKAQGELADSALQPDDIKDGTTKGTILVKDTAIKVGGLQDAAYVTKASILAEAKTEADEANTTLKQELIGTDNFTGSGDNTYASTIGGAKAYAYDIAVGTTAIGVQSAKAYAKEKYEEVLSLLTWQEIE